MDEESRRTAEEIFDKKNIKYLKGKEAAKFARNIEEYAKNEPSNSYIEKLLSSYNKTLEIALETIAKTKELLFSQLAAYPQINSSRNLLFGSNILSTNKEHAKVLRRILNETMKVHRVERLFRASEHGFTAADFHQRCDNKEDTLVLIRTEFGKTIGGYTHYPWESAGG